MRNEAGQPRTGRIALLGNFPPRLCGIATFTADTRLALLSADPAVAVDTYAMQDGGIVHDYPAEVVATIAQDDLTDYVAAAGRINDSGADVLLVQHEYGIFGGPAGNLLLRLLDRVEVPVVAILHTVLERPDPDQRTVMEALARRAARLVVMTDKGRSLLVSGYGVPEAQIAVVPHGVPDRPLADPDLAKARFGFDGRDVLLTFGLLSPNKGIETIIRALPAIAAAHPEVLYVVLGATHPNLVAKEGEAYREHLQLLAAELGVGGHVRFVDGFLETPLLLDYLEAADLYVTPYLNEAQIVSGTLSYAVSLGKPVVSTPYWHAVELVEDGGVGRLVDFGDVDGFGRAISGLLGDRGEMARMREQAWRIGRGMIWSAVGRAYLSICDEALRRRPVRLAPPPRQAAAPLRPDLRGVERMTDGCGMMQHSIFTVPDRDHGYCVDDNCRALMLMHRVTGEDATQADRLATVYASFVQHAWNGELGRFRNFMGFDRGWLEREGSEDSFGRSLWSLGATALEARDDTLRRWARHLFDQVAPHASALRSLRTWAFCVLGADAMLDAQPGNLPARQLLRACAGRLSEQLHTYRRDDWVWFEPSLGYDNARLSEALIRAGRRLGDREMMRDGLATLAWIDAIQTAPAGHFRAVGTESFGRGRAAPRPFDQQPIEAWATVDAMAYAHGVTGDARWLEAAWRAYRWFVGGNDLGLMLAADEGGCFDGLMRDRVNLNQGAESVLAFQFACATVGRLPLMTAAPAATTRTAPA